MDGIRGGKEGLGQCGIGDGVDSVDEEGDDVWFRREGGFLRGALSVGDSDGLWIEVCRAFC